MSVKQFDNGYWYATEVKSFAKSIGISTVSALGKDELEDLIDATGALRADSEA